MGNKVDFEYPVIDAERTGSLLRFICKGKNITVKDIQKHLHIASNQAIYDWFNGKTLPSLNNMYALSHLVNVPMERLLVSEKKQFSLYKNINYLIAYAKRIRACAN